MPRIRTLLALLALTAAGACKRAPPAPALEDAKAAAVLLERFETVVYVRTPLLPLEPQPGPAEAVDAVRERLGELPWALEAAHVDARALLRRSAVVLLGARDFRAPESKDGLGSVRSTRCFVLVLRAGETLDPARGLEAAARVAGEPALWTWTPMGDVHGEPGLTYFAAMGPGFLVAGNGAAETRATAAALASPGGAGGSERLRALGLLGRPAWSYRTYRPAADPEAAGVADVPRWANAMAILPDEGSPVVTVRLVGAPGAPDPTPDLAASGRLAQFTATAPGIWEARVSLHMEDLFLLQALQGFGSN